jgi:hypothetical protein
VRLSEESQNHQDEESQDESRSRQVVGSWGGILNAGLRHDCHRTQYGGSWLNGLLVNVRPSEQIVWPCRRKRFHR